MSGFSINEEVAEGILKPIVNATLEAVDLIQEFSKNTEDVNGVVGGGLQEVLDSLKGDSNYSLLRNAKELEEQTKVVKKEYIDFTSMTAEALNTDINLGM